MEARKGGCEVIDNFTLETMCYLKKLQSFRFNSNKQINKTLMEKFYLILEIIEDIFDGNPDIVKTEKEDFLKKFTLIYENIKSVIFCKFCSCVLVENINVIEDHMKLKHPTPNPIMEVPAANKDSTLVSTSSSKNNLPSPIGLAPISQDDKISNAPKAHITTDIIKIKSKNANAFLKYYHSVEQYNLQILKVEPIIEDITTSLNKHLKSHLLPVKVHLYGSRAFGLASKNSNFNFYLDTNGRLAPKGKVLAVSEYLQKHDSPWRVMRQNRNARIPSTEIKNINLNIHCKFTFENYSIHRAQVDLINYCFGIPIIRRVATLIKMVLNNSKININSYILSMLVIFFYQCQLMLPSCHTLTSFNNDLDKLTSYARFPIDDPTNCFMDFKSFCLFYSNFDFENHIISPYRGIIIGKDDFILLPENKGLVKGTPMCIQDPIERNINMAQDVTTKDLIKFVEQLKNYGLE